MTTVYFVSNQASNSFVVGDDSNDGLSKSAPFLTADRAFTAAALLTDVELIFNDGSYEYTLNNGQYALPTDTTHFSIDCVSDWQTLIVMSGSNDVKFSHDWSADDDVTCELHFGRVLFGSNASTGFTLYAVNKQNDLSYLAFESGARMLLSDGLSYVQILRYNCANRAQYHFYDSGFCGLSETFLDVPNTVLGTLFAPTNDRDVPDYLTVQVRMLLLNLRCRLSEPLIELGQSSENPSGVIGVESLRGKLIVSGETVQEYALVHLHALIGASYITRCRLYVELENTDSTLTGFSVSRAAGLDLAQYVIVSGNQLTSQATKGAGIVVGQEALSAITGAVVNNNKIDNANGVTLNGVVLHGLDDTLDNLVFGNETQGCDVHYQVKEGQAKLRFNLAYDGSTLYSDEAALASTVFDRNRAVLSEAFDGAVTYSSNNDATFSNLNVLTPLTLAQVNSQAVTLTVSGAEDLTGLTVQICNAFMQPLLTVPDCAFNASGELTLELTGIAAQSGDTLYYKVDNARRHRATLNGAHGVLTLP